MTHLPVVDFKTMEKVLINLGFHNTRCKGSHFFYRHPDGRTTTIPHHPGRDLSRPLIRMILSEIELSPEEFVLELSKI
jgi:predicted RNA binding protein YcfA (HicA-like mRNA interferase family)